jgi:hypothetical protein
VLGKTDFDCETSSKKDEDENSVRQSGQTGGFSGPARLYLALELSGTGRNDRWELWIHRADTKH